MAEDISELVVKIRADGAGEVQGTLEDTRETFSETTDDVGEATDDLTAFSKRWKGAALVFAGSFFTLVAAVASKMPILKESASGFDAILTAIGLRMDKLTRGSMSEFVVAQFELAEAIASGKGEFEAWLDLLGSGLRVIGDLLPGRFGDALTALGTFFREWDTIWAGIKRTVVDIVGDIDRFVHNNLVIPLIENVNTAIEALNKLPTVNIDPVEVPGAKTAMHPSGTPEAIGRRRSQEEQIIDRLTTGTVRTDVNIDGRKVGEATKPFTVRGVLSRRGLPGE